MIRVFFNNSAVILLLEVGVLRYAVEVLVLLDNRGDRDEGVVSIGRELISRRES